MSTKNAVGNSLTGSTGSGAFVGATSPTLVTPTLGAAAATSINFGDEALNKYDEGTWTPDLQFGGANTGIVYASQVGNYTRIGRIVKVQGYCLLSNKGSATGTATIAGLPFSSATINISNLYIQNIVFTGVPLIYTGISSSSLNLSTNQSGTTALVLSDTNFTNTSEIYFTVIYHV